MVCRFSRQEQQFDHVVGVKGLSKRDDTGYTLKIMYDRSLNGQREQRQPGREHYMSKDIEARRRIQGNFLAEKKQLLFIVHGNEKILRQF